MIRLAVLSDIPEMLRMGKLFFNDSGYDKFTQFNTDNVTTLLEELIKLDGIITDGKNGMIGFAQSPMFFNASCVLCQELFWWVDKSHRKNSLGVELLKAAESQAKKNGADVMAMLSINDLNGDKVNKLYESLGYKKQEQAYMRAI